MTIPALKLEVKKDGFQQLQSGAYKLTVTLQPADMHDNDENLLLDFIKAPMGQRYYIGMAEIGDDERPVSSQSKPAQASVSQRKPAATRAEKARRMCGIEAFQKFMINKHGRVWPTDPEATDYERTDYHVKQTCGVNSKSELDTQSVPMKRWDGLLAEYEQSVGRMAARTGG